MPAALQAFAIDVRSASAPESANRRASTLRSSRGPMEASTAVASTSGSSTHNAFRVFVVAAQRRTRRRRSSSSPTSVLSMADTLAPDQSRKRNASRCFDGSSR